MDNEYEGDIFIEKEMREYLLALALENLALICSIPQVFVHLIYVHQVRLQAEDLHYSYGDSVQKRWQKMTDK